MAKGKIIAKNVVKPDKSKFRFLDADGNLREVSRNTKGGKKGRTVCKTSAAKKKATAKAKTSKKRSTKMAKRGKKK